MFLASLRICKQTAGPSTTFYARASPNFAQNDTSSTTNQPPTLYVDTTLVGGDGGVAGLIGFEVVAVAYDDGGADEKKEA